MKRCFRVRIAVLAVVALVAGIGVSPRAFSQAEKSSPAQNGNGASNYEKMDAPETNAEEEAYRHSSAVQAIAKVLHTNTETAATIFEFFNSSIIIIAILALLMKVLPKAFRKRSETIQKDLAEAHSATEDANKRLSAVEARLARLDSEIEAIRRQVEQEALEDEKHIKAALEEERKRIIASAEQEIEAYSAMAQRELKRFAADLAVERALQRIHLGADADRILVQNFTADLAKTQGKGGQN
ncbi:MAG TPA: ATP synthase F0 subunit B [Pseudacidobacterium sp.]|nr:ATP synthase F0 subunit B [Pseudacidobacterium sp.]